MHHEAAAPVPVPGRKNIHPYGCRFGSEGARGLLSRAMIVVARTPVAGPFLHWKNFACQPQLGAEKIPSSPPSGRGFAAVTF